MRLFVFSIFWVISLSFVPFGTDVWARNIVIFGDSQHDNAVQEKIVSLALSFEPTAVFRVGDLVDDGNSPEHWKTFRRINKPLLRKVRYYPALGNHERASPLYFSEFPIIKNKSWYFVHEEGIDFFILDSNQDLKAGSAQYQDLFKALQDSRAEYKIAIFHHPLFNVAIHKEDEKGLRSVLVPLFLEYGVAAVFSGHEHTYQRFEYEGMPFVVTGGGGSHLKATTRGSPYLQVYKRTYHLCVLTRGKKSLRVRVIDSRNKPVDEFEILPLSRRQGARN